ncbi:energy transducer TonB [Dyella sp. 20L07]|uniref:energy transducer TonB n=1 Tax=Dyella sp. 20L07 TaxID=3384240 RepID=UPI003D2904BF
MKLGSKIWICTLLVGAMATANAENIRKTAEGSMLVTGVVEINPDGSLHGYTLDQAEKLPAPVLDVISKNMADWKFKLSAPSNGVVNSKMSLRMLAKPLGEGNYGVTLAGASFGENDSKTGDTVSFKSHMPAPSYPPMALNARVSGTAYLLLRIGRDGTVQEAVAEQVNLEQYASKIEMDQYRKALANAALDAAKQWTYNLPTHGPEVDNPYWVARVPVNFNLRKRGQPIQERPYGSWKGYIPGPRQSAPWVSQALLSEAPDAVPNDTLHSGNSGLQLTTTLGGT